MTVTIVHIHSNEQMLMENVLRSGGAIKASDKLIVDSVDTQI